MSSKSNTFSLLDLFPEGSDGQRKPLPKQEEFLRLCAQPEIPSYIRYLGGIGSGKSVVGCVAILSWALMYPGDYLISRQYSPELADTTWKQFNQLVDQLPESLVVDRRVADRIITLRTVDGKTSNILARQLEDPDKLRSLNLNAAFIDEANQVSEEAFLLLQGRLRGKYVRKIIMAQNPAGHNWSWRLFVEKKGFDEETKKLFANIQAPSTENVHLPTNYVANAMKTWSKERVQREIFGNEDSFEGQIYPEFNRLIHVIPPFKIPENWTRVIGADHGHRNPACWLWGAVSPEGIVYIYREFYEREWDVDEIINGKKDKVTGERIPDKKGVLSLNNKEKFDSIEMDPSTDNNIGGKSGTIMAQYKDAAPVDWYFHKANNDVLAGIDHVKKYLKIREEDNQPSLYIFSTCTNLIEEMMNYRWMETPANRSGKENDKEKPVKYKDHAADSARYLLMALPEPFSEEKDWYQKTGFHPTSLEARVHREWEELHKPAKKSDPWGSYN